MLARMLRWKVSKENVLAAARLLRCSACEEATHQGRNPCQRLMRTENPGESSVCDMAEWNHPVSETR